MYPLEKKKIIISFRLHLWGPIGTGTAVAWQIWGHCSKRALHTGSFFFRVQSHCAVLSILRGRTIDFSGLHAVAELGIEPCKRLGCLLKLGLFENVYIHVDYSAETND